MVAVPMRLSSSTFVFFLANVERVVSHHLRVPLRCDHDAAIAERPARWQQAMIFWRQFFASTNLRLREEHRRTWPCCYGCGDSAVLRSLKYLPRNAVVINTKLPKWMPEPNKNNDRRRWDDDYSRENFGAGYRANILTMIHSGSRSKSTRLSFWSQLRLLVIVCHA
jgi:hypothetical protein